MSEERFFQWLKLTAASVAFVCFAVLFVSIAVLFAVNVWKEIEQVVGGGA